MDHREIVIRLVTAAVLGGLVGLERERLEWVAGLRTHMLVCLGATLVMIVSAHGFDDVVEAYRVVLDPSRVAAQVVSGIGFLGAGTILFLRHEIIRGLTTAASLWTVAAVGLAVGGGLYVAAVCTTALVLVILAVVKPFERKLFRRDQSRRVRVHVDRAVVSLAQIEAAFEASGLTVEQITVKRMDDGDTIDCLLLHHARNDSLDGLRARLRSLEGVRSIAA